MESSLEFERQRNVITNLIQNYQYQQAITCCTRLISRCKPSENLVLTYQYFYWGHCCYRQGKYQEGISRTVRALDLSPDFYEAFIGWGNCLANMGRYDEAIEKYKEATKLHPSSAFACVNWILVLLLQNKEEEAVAIAKENFEKTKYRTLDICTMRYRNEILKIEDHIPNVTDADEMKRLVDRLKHLKLLIQFIQKLKNL